MAGGLGKRMESDTPKVLHEVCHPTNSEIKYPMIIHVILTALKLNPSKIFIIVGKYKNSIKKTIDQYLFGWKDNIQYIIQENPNGTGHAILCSLPYIQSEYIDENALILSGDIPLISSDTLRIMNGDDNKILITNLKNPFGYGRIITDQNNQVIDIVEEKDCNENENALSLHDNCEENDNNTALLDEDENDNLENNEIVGNNLKKMIEDELNESP
jgi:bifunctional N-acetylglucosamine-1-phosphate-uridyltransferase/glucosamine-1-phosphate-acetyltransferase GlmU-like protein